LHLPIPLGAEDDVGYTLLHHRTRIHVCAGRDREDRKAWSELFYGGNQEQAPQTVGSQVQDDEIGSQRPHGRSIPESQTVNRSTLVPKRSATASRTAGLSEHRMMCMLTIRSASRQRNDADR
jgi:hypothetical protein